MSKNGHALPAAEAVSLRDAAAILRVSRMTIWRWGRSGRLRMVRAGPKLLRVPRSELSRVLKQI